MTEEELGCYGGYCSIEEHMQDCLGVFLKLQQYEEGQQLEKSREQGVGQQPERSWEQERGWNSKDIRKQDECTLESIQEQEGSWNSESIREQGKVRNQEGFQKQGKAQNLEDTQKPEKEWHLENIQELAAGILEREQNSQIFLPAPYLRERCKLTETEYWLVMFAFCCELETGLCLHFWKKYNNKWPMVQYALHLLSNVFSVDFTLIAELCAHEPPLGDILALPPEGERNQGILQQPLLLGRTAFYFLLTGTFPKEKWCEFYIPQVFGGRNETIDGLSDKKCNIHEKEYAMPDRELDIREEKYVIPDRELDIYEEEYVIPNRELDIYEEEYVIPNRELGIHQEEYAMLARCIQENTCLRILVNGRQGSGKHTLIKRLVSRGSRIGILLNMPYLYNTDASTWEEVGKSMALMDALANPIAILDFQGLSYGENAGGENQKSRLEFFLKERKGNDLIFFLTDTIQSREMVKKFTDIHVDLKEFLSGEEKRMALDNFVNPMERRQWQDELLARYRLNIGELHKKLKTIRFLSEKYGLSLKEEKPWLEGIAEAAVQNRLGKIVESNYTLEDLIIPQDCRRQLETVIRLAKVWFGGTAGLEGKQEGLQMLFHGASGTGKTMAASVLAAHLHLPLFKVDLSRIFDKYVGETEKHLDEIFQTAQRNNYILFFDEADALFSKRMGIQDSHDKYANIATSYLLQRMEMYDGILILATNLMDHFDDAFLRRIRFVIKFRNLDKEDRALLWERLLAGAALAEDVSIQALAQAAELGPARIRAAVQTAKMLAAGEEGGKLTGRHFRAALELETGKDETTLNYITLNFV